MVMEGDLTWGGEHTVQCTDDVLWKCAAETCITLLTSVTQINSIKVKEKRLVMEEGIQTRWVPACSFMPVYFS